MKIGIFGDSYTQKYNNSDIVNDTKNWVDLLGQKYQLTNFGSGGSNLYYSVTKFKKYHANFEKNIFIVTEPGRLRLNSGPLLNIPGLHTAEHNYNQIMKNLASPVVENLLNFPTDKMKLQILQAAIDYYTYIKNDDYDQYVHNLMINDIVSLRHDTIFIPINEHSLPNCSSKNQLNCIYRLENLEWGFHAGPNMEDIRHSHMTYENNVILADKVEEWLHGKPVDIDINDFIKPDISLRDFYLKKQ